MAEQSTSERRAQAERVRLALRAAHRLLIEQAKEKDMTARDRWVLFCCARKITFLVYGLGGLPPKRAIVACKT